MWHFLLNYFELFPPSLYLVNVRYFLQLNLMNILVTIVYFCLVFLYLLIQLTNVSFMFFCWVL